MGRFEGGRPDCHAPAEARMNRLMLEIAGMKFLRLKQKVASLAISSPKYRSAAIGRRSEPNQGARGFRFAMGWYLKLGGRRSRFFPHRIKVKLVCRKFPLLGVGNMHQG